MRSSDRLSTYATTIAADGDATVITYHRTAIVRFDADKITLNMGGYDTVTTRRKMNQAARQFCLPFTVYRIKGDTFMRSTLTGEAQPVDTRGANILPRRVSALHNAG